MSWSEVRLGEHSEVLSGFAFESKAFNTEGRGKSLIRIRDVVPARTSTYYEGDFDPRFVVSNGETLIGMDGDFNRARWKGGEALLNQRVCKISAKNGLDDGYLFHLLPQVLQKIADRTPFVTVKHLSAKDLKEFPIPLPPLEEQKRIAGILDQAEGLRRLRARALDKLNTLGQAIFHEMFGRAAKTESEQVDLGELLKFVTSGGRGWAKYYCSSGRRFLRSLDVQINSIGEEDIAFVHPPDNAEARRTRTEPGDVLLTITGSKIGRAAPLPDDLSGSYISQHVAILRPDTSQLLPCFLSYFLSMEQFGQRQIKAKQYGQAKPGLNFQQIRSFRLAKVSLEQQKHFVQTLAEVEVTRDRLIESGQRSDHLFASLQHRAFRGEL